MYHKSFSSLATGPKTLFHIGLSSHFASLVKSTIALSPNLI
ncbi:MAG: hypothetical protein WCG25_00055 [bacterium]